MFIVAKRSYLVRRADGSPFKIEKDYIGEIPEDVAESRLVQRAIRGGMIAVPQGMTDKALEQADGEAGEKAGQKDIRPDAGVGSAAGNLDDAGGSKDNEPDNAEHGEGKEAGRRSQKKQG